MKNAIILHGKPRRERYENPQEPKPHEANWLPWLGKQLATRGIESAIPAMPLPYHPVYLDWKKVFEAEDVGPDTGLVGHSAGAEFILRWLSEDHERRVSQAVLVAPYHDYLGKYGDFSRYALDGTILERVGKLSIINSLDDDESITQRAHELSVVFPRAASFELDGFGHFRIGHNMKSEEFPELLEVLGV
jgi:predicted alpha/beta hydrolase family esterase